MGSPPWLKAPILLLRFPALLIALGSAFLILAIASAASPLFLSSAGNATLQRTLADYCPWDAGLEMRIPAPLVGQSLFFGQLAPQEPQQSAVSALLGTDQQLRDTFGTVPRTSPVQWSIVGSSITVSRPGTNLEFPDFVRMLTRDDGLAHTTQVGSAAGGDGIWLPDNVAKALRVRAGETVALNGPRKSVKVRVAGVFRNLTALPRSRFWCGQESLIHSFSAYSNRPPPPLILAERDTFLSLGRRMGEAGALVSWDVQVPATGLTVSGAHQAVADMQSTVDRVFRAGFGSRITFDLPFISDLASATQDSMRGSVDTVSLAGRLVALVVIGAAGIYWVHRRRVEVGLLTARGASPAGLGAKVLLETLGVAILAGAAGWVVALWLVRRFGPSRLLDTTAPSSALTQVVWTSLAALLVLAVVAAIAIRQQSEISVSRARQALARAPWEVPVLLLAAASLYEILSRRPPHITDVRVPTKPDVLILLFPILFIAGASGLVTRGIQRILPRLRTAGRRWPPALYLSSRRLSAAPQTAMVLLTVTALAIGILSYAGALTASESASADAKAQVFVGSDVAVNVAISRGLPSRLPFPATRLTRVTTAQIQGLPSGSNGVDILGVDTATFPRVAYWDASLASRSLGELMADLRAAPSDPLPVITVGGIPPQRTIAVGSKLVPYRAVGSARAFPGLHADQPMVIMRREDLVQRKITGIEQVWARGDSRRILSVLRRGGSIIEGSEVLADETRTLPQFSSLRWALGFLQSLGVLTGLIALGGILLFLESRQRAREVAYALARRMGLSKKDHRRSVAIELAAMLAVGVVLGIVLAWVGARLVYGKLDPMPLLPPAPLFRSPYFLMGITALSALFASWIGAWRVQRTAERVNVAEVMRVAG